MTVKWPNERLVKTRAVSGFIFLRLLCPAILNPRQFNLISEPPSPAANRSLVMVAKCLQNLANLVEFGVKESYMEVVNPFILKNKERMVVFLDHLSVRLTRCPSSHFVSFTLNVSVQSVREKPYPDEERVKGDPARDLATIHHLCEGSIIELQNMAKSQVSLLSLNMSVPAMTRTCHFQPQIKTLVTVTEMLTKHKQKYTEMINAASSASSTNNPALM